jgi:small ligand-binding sensory domain FIST
MKDGIHFASGTAVDLPVDEAVDTLVDQVKAQFPEEEEPVLDLALVFLSAHFTHQARQVAEGLLAFLQPGVLLGCTAEGVIGREREIEDRAAITLVVARLPGVIISPFTLHPHDWPRLLLDTEEFRRTVEAPEDTRLFIMIGDPFSSPVDDVLQAFNTVYNGIPIVGGMASGALRQFGNALLLNDQVTNLGIIGASLAGPVDVDLIVSQGCRPIWRPFRITAAQKNMVFSLDGKPPLTWIQELIPELSEEDRALMQSGLFVGRAVRGTPETLGRGDFLIRGVVGVDRQSGAIAIADSVVEGEVIQFHLRDALTAQEDLEMMLIPQMFCDPPSGALLFSCNGRGTKLYDYPDGDITMVQKNLQGVPVAGFFCAGEIGPIGNENYLHGHTASMVIFRPAGGADPE